MSVTGHADEPNSTDGWGWEVFSFFFWFGVFVFLFYTTLAPSNPFKIERIEPWLLAISIISTVLYSYLYIFFRNLFALRLKWISLSFIATFTLLELYLCFVLGTIFIYDARLGYSVSNIPGAALDRFDLVVSRDILEFSYNHHALIIVLILSIIDIVIAIFHNNAAQRCRFMRLILMIDAPTLIALATVFIIRAHWTARWGGILDGLKFEAGAITFQLLAANASIVAAGALDWFQPRPPYRPTSPVTPTSPNPMLSTGSTLPAGLEVDARTAAASLQQNRDTRGRFVKRTNERGPNVSQS
jgi:hypothetical protein